jgi:hypothetical protein
MCLTFVGRVLIIVVRFAFVLKCSCEIPIFSTSVCSWVSLATAPSQSSEQFSLLGTSWQWSNYSSACMYLLLSLFTVFDCVHICWMVSLTARVSASEVCVVIGLIEQTKPGACTPYSNNYVIRYFSSAISFSMVWPCLLNVTWAGSRHSAAEIQGRLI